jgi:hypothetical protein
MARFLIVLVIVPAVYWLYRQTAKPRGSRQILEPPPTADVPIAVEKSQIELPQLEVLQSDGAGGAEATRRSASDEAVNVIDLQQPPLETEEIELGISSRSDGVKATASNGSYPVEPAGQTGLGSAISSEGRRRLEVPGAVLPADKRPDSLASMLPYGIPVSSPFDSGIDRL